MQTLDIKEMAPWLLGASGAAGIVFAFWGQVKGFWTSTSSMVVVNVTVDSNLSGPVLSWLNRHAKRLKLGPSTFISSHEYVKSQGRIRKIAFDVIASVPQTFFLRRKPIWFKLATSSIGTPVDDVRSGGTISFIRGTMKWKEILQSALNEEDDFIANTSERTRQGTRYRVKHVFGESIMRAGSYKRGKDDSEKSANSSPVMHIGRTIDRFSSAEPVFWTWDDFGIPQTSSINTLALDDELQSVVAEVRFWYDSKAWFVERAIAWRCGLLFHGAPGTGKTSLARALAEELDLPVFVFDLASMTNAEFIEEWKSSLSQSPCMVLLEDIDGVFNGRKNVAVKDGEGGLTFDCLLNSLDGIERADGVLLVVTTNNLEYVDAALAKLPEEGAEDMPSRPGRIDRMVGFRHLTEVGRRKVALRITQSEEDAQRLMLLGKNDTGAQFQLRCIRVARQRFFSGRQADILEFGKALRAQFREGSPSAKFMPSEKVES